MADGRRTGGIAPGKLANFTVLAQNPYAVALEDLSKIEVLGSVYAGRCIRL